MALALRYAACSDVGLLRDGNEDSGYAGPRLLVVADGMGGHVGGEVASSAAVASLAVLDEDAPGGDLLARLSRAVQDANDELRRMVAADPSLDGMGTTLTVLLRAGSKLGLAHVGDSRCYLLRSGSLEQITKDHTFVQSLVDEGRISAEQAEQHPQRALVTRALDGRDDVEADLSVREARVGDRYLLCSDGLPAAVSTDTFASTLTEIAEPAGACQRLIDLALRGGAPDNVTCVVADVVDVGEAPSPVPQAVGAAAHDFRIPRTSAADSAAERAAALTPRGARTSAALRGRDSERAARSSRWRRYGPLTALVLLLALLGGIGYAVWTWSQRQYYVGADGDAVAIFRGVGSNIGGRALSSVEERRNLPLGTLPDYTRGRVSDTISARDLDDARRIVGRIEQQASACGSRPAPAGPQSGPAPTDLSALRGAASIGSPTPQGSGSGSAAAGTPATGPASTSPPPGSGVAAGSPSASLPTLPVLPVLGCGDLSL